MIPQRTIVEKQKIEYKDISFWCGTASDYHNSLLKLIDENKEMFGWENE